MAPFEGLAERIEAGRLAKGWSKAQLCEAAGLRQQRYAAVLRRATPKYVQRVATALGVRVEWLTTGAYPPEWYRVGMGMQTAVEHAEAAAKAEAKQLRGEGDRPGTTIEPLPVAHIPIIGVVTAGSGWADPSQDPEDWKPISIPAHWRAVRIQGDSGYPVVWDGQTVLVDDRLPLKHNRLVVVQTEDRRAYLKRYCVCEHVPAGFILSSVNIGRDSFALPPDQPVRIAVVVGTLFTDSVVR